MSDSERITQLAEATIQLTQITKQIAELVNKHERQVAQLYKDIEVLKERIDPRNGRF